MGLANLVPGISGGTMLLAAGVYPRFIKAISELTRFTFRFSSLLVLAVVVAAAGVSILTLSGTIKNLVVHHRWAMYSLFIGLTLGGVPVLWNLIKQARAAHPSLTSVWVGMFFGILGMVGLTLAQGIETGRCDSDSFIIMLVAGIAGASAMILPGVSGAYLLLVLGAYEPILSGVEDFFHALKAFDFGAMIAPFLGVVLPVGIGVVVGVVVVSNLLRRLLEHYEKPTLGVLLGLLIGAVVGLWPFQEGRPPQVGETFKCTEIVDQATLDKVLADTKPHKYKTVYVDPTGPIQVASSIGLILVGFAATSLVARFGRDKPSA